VSRDEAAGYLSAMIDGEGAVYAVGHNRSIHIYNTDLGVIEGCLEACEVLGIKAGCAVRDKPSKLSKHPLWTISFYGRENLEHTASALTLRSDRKREALSRALSSFTRRKPVTKEEFEEMIARGLTHREMTTELGYKSHSTAQYHLRRLGLPT
jgi:1,2-phenylacetyl-CoA epoxidase PaaB subunit